MKNSLDNNNNNNLNPKNQIISFNNNSNTNSINNNNNNTNNNSNLNNNNLYNYNITNSSPALLRKIKQIENILNQKLVNITELRSIAWKGLPYGKNNLI